MRDKPEIKELAESIMLRLEEQLITDIGEGFDIVLHQMEVISKINTKNVKAMSLPHSHTFTYMRDDNCTDRLKQEEVLNNAPKSKDGYILLPKVV